MEIVVGYAQYDPLRSWGNGNIPLEFAAVGETHPLAAELAEEEAVLVVADPLADPELLDRPVLGAVPPLEPPEAPSDDVDCEAVVEPVEPVPSDEVFVVDPAHP